MTEERKQVEALLFSSGKAMSVDDLVAITGIDKKIVKKSLKELKEDYNSRDTSLMLIEEGDSWKLNIREQYVSLVTKIIADTELSTTVLETLGVIAWKAPMLQSEVVKVRSSQAYDHIKELVEMGFIRKEREGRSYILRLSEKFFEYFDVPGDKGIKEALKEVKIPEKPSHLGKLEVVELSGEKTEEQKLKEQQEREELTKRLEERRKEIKVDKDFLNSMGEKIEEVSTRNDELDKDVLFVREKLVEEGAVLDQDEKNEENNLNLLATEDKTEVQNDEVLSESTNGSSNNSSENGVIDETSENIKDDEEVKEENNSESNILDESKSVKDEVEESEIEEGSDDVDEASDVEESTETPEEEEKKDDILS